MSQVRIALRMERKSILAWSIGIACYLGLMGGLYAALGGSEELAKLTEEYPEGVADAFGDDLASVQGFLDAEAGTFIPLVLGILFIAWASKHLAGAEEAGRLDHLLARPISRSEYYWATLLSAFVGSAIIFAAGALAAILGFVAEATGKEMQGILGWAAEFWILCWTFIGIGGLLGALFHRKVLANGIGAAIVAGFFVLNLAARLVPELDWLAYLTPMGFLDDSDLFHGKLDLWFLLLCAGLAAMTSIAGWRIFRTKNLYA